MMKPDGIIDEASVLGGYSKWKDRSSDKQRIEYYNLLTKYSSIGNNKPPCITEQIKLLARPCTYTVTLLCRSV